jgi:hypothetical protein
MPSYPMIGREYTTDSGRRAAWHMDVWKGYVIEYLVFTDLDGSIWTPIGPNFDYPLETQKWSE